MVGLSHMDKMLRFICLLIVLRLNPLEGQIWPLPNAIDEIKDQMDNVTAENCNDLEVEALRLPIDTLAQLPRYYQISDKDYYVPENRTNLYLQHNLALAKGIFWSFTNQLMNETSDFVNQPSWLYHYVSTWADATSGPIHGSGLFYDQNKSYANWYPLLPFNQTLGLFGPCAWKIPDTEDLESTDYGAEGVNYTLPSSKHTPWYDLFLPDDTPGLDSVRKWSHLVTLKYAINSTEINQTFFTHAMSMEDDFEYLPVVFTAPYFDCGRSNQWIVSAVSPFVDHIPRYLEWFHLRRFTFTGEATSDVDFQSIDINPCPLSVGNEAPNYFASSDLCKPTTVCEPVPGFGLQRGGYQCTCQPGLIYPPGQDGPFQGIDIESASWEEYQAGFDCIQGNSTHLEEERTNMHNDITEAKESFLPRYRFDDPEMKTGFDPMQQLKVDAALKRKADINEDSCLYASHEELLLPEELVYKVDEDFITQARMATRLAHFLSKYLQNVSPEESLRDDPGFRPDQIFHVDHMYGEVLAMVMADTHIRASGIYFDEGKFIASDGVERVYFAPFAFKNNISSEMSDWSVVDAVETLPFYADDPWFLYLKEVWEGDLIGLHPSSLNLVVRSNIDGDDVMVHERSPLESYTGRTEEGLWWGPYYKCDGYINDWVISYAAPFFGWSLENPGVIEFQGAVAIDVLLDDTVPNQCDNDPRNFWSNTAKCNFQTSQCVASSSHYLGVGAYRCVCTHDNNVWVEGKELEEEFDKLVAGQENSFSYLQSVCG